MFCVLGVFFVFGVWFTVAFVFVHGNLGNQVWSARLNLFSLTIYTITDFFAATGMEKNKICR